MADVQIYLIKIHLRSVLFIWQLMKKEYLCKKKKHRWTTASTASQQPSSVRVADRTVDTEMLPFWNPTSRLTCVSLSFFVTFFEGDKLYSFSSGVTEKIGNTEDDPRAPQDSGLHRVVILGSHALQLQVTVTPKYNHLLPIDHRAHSSDMEGQLWFVATVTLVSGLWIHHSRLLTDLFC